MVREIKKNNSDNNRKTSAQFALNECNQKLIDQWRRLECDISYDKFRAHISDIADDDEALRGIATSLLFNSIYKGNSSLSFYLATSCIYSVRAERMLNSSDLESVWPMILKLSYSQGVVDGLRSNENPDNLELISQRARKKGGERKSANNDPARKEIIRLLEEKRPPNGWRSKAAAAKEIHPFMDDFVANNKGLSITRSNLANLIRKWLTENPEIKAAYERIQRSQA